MDYSEAPPPDALRHLVKLGWALSVPADASPWVIHVATPDGCMEIIYRVRGRSRWNKEQPPCFVAGLITRPAEIHLSRGSSFVALRIWPWTWRLMTGESPGQLLNDWLAVDSLPATDNVEKAFDSLLQFRLAGPDPGFVDALLTARSCREASASTGMAPRTLQRWFARNVGVAPRTYLRLLRFSDAFASLPSTETGLAEHAQDHGFADQAHMARDFRLLAGAPAKEARVNARGPFIKARIDRS